MTLSEPQSGDVWLTYLRFSDKPHMGKVRPIVVADVCGNKVLALKVTSKSPRPESGDLLVQDLACAGLRLPSSIWLSPSFVLKRSELLRDEPIGHLSEKDMKAVEVGLRRLEHLRGL